MSRWSRPWWALVSALALTSAVADTYRDPRSHEVVRLDCTTNQYRRDLTLFGNGTLRLKQGEIGAEAMELSELDPDTLEGYVRRLQAETLGDDAGPPNRVEGPWTEQCVLTLDVDEGPVGSAAFGAFDSLSLELSRVLTIARELEALARTQTRVTGLKPDYSPQRGEVLLRRDGQRFRVRGVTTDGLAIELVGLEQPLTLYVALEALREQFIAVVEPR